MTDEIRKCLQDIITAIESIESYLQGRKDFNHYVTDKMLRRAVERELEIIGEAMNTILAIKPDIQVTNARRIVDTRNRIIHAYDAVNDTVVWSIVIRHLPVLRDEVALLLLSDDETVG
mgnify:CR=1 FL=1